MFTIRKLEALPPRTRRRKIERILHAAEAECARGAFPDRAYIVSVLGVLVEDRGVSAALKERVATLLPGLAGSDTAAVLRTVNAIRNRLLLEMGAEPSEWDLTASDGAGLDGEARRVFPFRVYLEDVRSPFNVGSMFRTSECFGVGEVLLSPDTPLPTHPRAAKSARGTAAVVPWRVAGLDALGDDPGLFALELGGAPLAEFAFPRAGTVIVGSEELGVSPEALALAGRARGRVSIPLYGAKQSLNVAVAFGILMNAWASSATVDTVAGTGDHGRHAL
jgi:RNA methyltransferase, TrmH family